MEKKAQGMTINKLITIILIVVTIALVLLFMFNKDIFHWFKGLPGYGGVNDSDIIIDPGNIDHIISGACASEDGTLVGEFSSNPSLGDETFLYLKEKSLGNLATNLYLTDRYNGELKLLEKTANLFTWNIDTLVGTTNSQGVIKINPDFLDLNKEYYQKIRFNPNNVEMYLEFASVLQKLNGSKVIGQMICKNGNDSELIEMWPKSVGKKINNITLVTEIINPWNHYPRLKIDFSPHIELNELNYFYLVKRNNYFEIKGDKFGFDYANLGRIYNDGSIWISKDRMGITAPGIVKSGDRLVDLNLSEDFFYTFNINYDPFYETNLRINYFELTKKYNEK
jgi:hypothetical protein